MPRLTVHQVKNTSNRGMYCDGDGLYLQVSASGAKSWILRFHFDGKYRDMGLGSVKTLSLADARDAALEARKLRSKGINPIEERKKQRASAQREAAKAVNFQICVESYVQAHKSSWRSEKHKRQWAATLEKYAYPIFGDLPVGEIDRALVLKVLNPIWYEKTETASRVRGRIEKVLDFARVQGYREGENPALWKGNLSLALPAKNKIAKPEHMRSLPHAEMADFWKKLSAYEGAGADALRLTILTAARSGEVRGATADEFDLENKVWTIPAERMKAAKEHRIPLSPPAVTLMKRLFKNRTGDLLFPGMKEGKPISDATILAVLKRMDYQKKTTVHGFRSSFRIWTTEVANARREVAEAALAHTLGSAVEIAYMRSDLLEQRVKLMDDWAAYIIKSTKD